MNALPGWNSKQKIDYFLIKLGLGDSINDSFPFTSVQARHVAGVITALGIDVEVGATRGRDLHAEVATFRSTPFAGQPIPPGGRFLRAWQSKLFSYQCSGVL